MKPTRKTSSISVGRGKKGARDAAVSIPKKSEKLSGGDALYVKGANNAEKLKTIRRQQEALYKKAVDEGWAGKVDPRNEMRKSLSRAESIILDRAKLKPTPKMVIAAAKKKSKTGN